MLSCKEYTDLRKKELKEYIEKEGLHPKLVVIQVGDRPESNSYIRGKMRDCKEVGIKCLHQKYTGGMTQDFLESLIKAYNLNPDIHGIILQLPVPDHIDVKRIQNLIKPEKDVDGFNLMSPFEPCTPSGVIGYLKHIGYEFEGKDALVIGRSDIVGKPLARMLTDLDCTVTLAHSKSKYIPDHISMADIIFTCIDKIEYFYDLDGEINQFTDVIDIGLGPGENGELRGNIHRECVGRIKELQYKDNFIISGTGGVGLLTRLALVENVVKACEVQKG